MNTDKRFRYFRQTVTVIGLILLFLIVQWAANAFQKPGHMGVLESQTMKMAVQPPEGAMPVVTETIHPEVFDSAVTYTGSAVAYNDVPIYPRTEGWITALPVYPGDKVKKGQVLAQLDTRELNARFQESQSLQAKARQGVQSARANRDYWQNKIERSRVLVNPKHVTLESRLQRASALARARRRLVIAQTEEG